MDAQRDVPRHPAADVSADEDLVPAIEAACDGGPAEFPELTESSWSRFIAETGRHFPDAAFAKAVHMAHPAPAYAVEYERLWKVPVRFATAWNAIAIEPSWLTIELHNPSAYASAVLSKHANELLATLATTKTTRGRVESVLLPILHQGDVGMETIARRLGLSRPSLYRQLKQEAVTFEAILDELRHRMALYYGPDALATARRVGVGYVARVLDLDGATPCLVVKPGEAAREIPGRPFPAPRTASLPGAS